MRQVRRTVALPCWYAPRWRPVFDDLGQLLVHDVASAGGRRAVRAGVGQHALGGAGSSVSGRHWAYVKDRADRWANPQPAATTGSYELPSW